MQYLLLFHCTCGCTKASQCYVVRTLPSLFRRYGQMFAKNVLSPFWWPRLLLRKSNGTLSTDCGFVLYIQRRLDGEFAVTVTFTHCKLNPYHGREAGKLSRYSDSLRAGRYGNQIPVGARFFPPVQNGPGAHPASYTMGTGSPLGVKRAGRGVDHPPSSSSEVKETVELCLYSP
jgi:hypothetical protein